MKQVDCERVIELTKKKIREDECTVKKARVIYRVPLIAAAIALILTFTAFAAGRILMSPKEIAEHAENSLLAEAFGKDDVLFDMEPQVSGDYKFSVLGIISGAHLEEYTDVDKERSYIVGAVERADGGKIFDFTGINITPLIQGELPWRVNAWTLNGARTEFIYEDMVDYFIFECDNIEVFADREIYLAMYEHGMAPSAEIFEMDADGKIKFKDDCEGAKAIFTLPIDKSKADPKRAQEILDSIGLYGEDSDNVTDVTLGDEDTSYSIELVEGEAEDKIDITFSGKDEEAALQETYTSVLEAD